MHCLFYPPLKIQKTKAESWTLRESELPRPAQREWVPGPAVKLLLNGPQEVTGGDSLRVKVKAVDAFGNLAKTYQGTVQLEVKAS